MGRGLRGGLWNLDNRCDGFGPGCDGTGGEMNAQKTCTKDNPNQLQVQVRLLSVNESYMLLKQSGQKSCFGKMLYYFPFYCQEKTSCPQYLLSLADFQVLSNSSKLDRMDEEV